MHTATRTASRLATLLWIRFLHVITGPDRDRGDSPVSTAVIVAIIAAGAVVIATAIIAVARGWVAIIPTAGG
jgi:hypothetical protein